MANFKTIIQSLNHLDNEQSISIPHSKKMILIKNLLKELKTTLSEDEFIFGYLPLDSYENNTITTTGWMGLEYVHSEEGKEYLKTFKNVRGNRLLVFTNKRILSVVPIHFIETKKYYSYLYKNIPAFTIKEIKQWGAKKETKDYYFDFYAEGATGIFSEMINERDKQLLLEILSTIPEAKTIEINEKIVRKRKFDKIFNNPQLGFKFISLSNVFWVLLLVILLLGFFFGIGPMKAFYFRLFLS